MHRLERRKNRKVAVVACARKLAVLVWKVLTSGEPFRYTVPKTLEAKYSRLRIRATGQRRKTGPRAGTPRSPRYGTKERTKRIPSLAEVLQQNAVPPLTDLPPGESKMLAKKQLNNFYPSLHVSSRIKKASKGDAQTT
jgi:hypothetical protein